MDKNASIYVAGHRGLVGSAIVRRLEALGHDHIATRTHAELDLTNQEQVAGFFANVRPEYVFLAAAKVGGILANDTYPATFIAENLAIQTNTIEAAHRNGVRKLLFLGSSCIYPRDCPQPMREEHMLTGPLEPTNEAYAIAKIAGIEMCRAYNRQYGTNYISVMPTNLYGPGDNFDLDDSHVLAALLRKFHEAKRRDDGVPVDLWGSGAPQREFLHVDDLADACVHLMNRYDGGEPVNVGSGEEISIAALAKLIAGVVGYDGPVAWDASRPDGTPRKLLDIAKLHAAGWHHRISLEEGLRSTYDWYVGAVEGAASGSGPAIRGLAV
jgi:GDP-L-fucose synthase